MSIRPVVLLTAFVLALLTPSAAAAQAGVSAGAGAAVRAAAARVEAGDRLVVKVYREPLLSDTVMVNARGEVVLARVGTVPVGTLTLAALEDTLRARYGAFLRNPAVDLVVLRRVAVNGEVAKPDVYYVDVATTLRDVIAIAGGITENGADDRVEIVRDGERRRVPNWQDDVTRTADLHSGDEILVGRRSWIQRNALNLASTALLFTSVIVTLVR